MMMFKTKFLAMTGLLSIFFSPVARAEFSFSCGKDREMGAKLAEIGFLDSFDSVMRLYLKGEEVSERNTAFLATEGQQWIVTLDRGAGKGTRRFEFQIKDSSVQEFSTTDKGKDEKVGDVKKCDYKRVD